MQRDDRLAGPGPSLHDEHTRLGGADDLVLLTLDRGHDVTERAGSTALQRGEQRRVAAQSLTASRRVLPHVTVERFEAFVVPDAEVPGTEQLVFDAEQRPAVHREVASPRQPHRLATGGPVERLGDRRTPVDHDRFAVFVGDGEPADVVRLGGVGFVADPIDAAEHQ